MGYTPGRRSNGGLKGSTPKSRWVYLAWSAALAVLWLTVTILLVPPELASINKKLSSVGIADDTVVAEDERPAPNDWNAAHDPFPSSARRHVRPSKDRPRANISMATIVNNMRSFLDELDIAFKNVHEPEPMRIWNIYKAAVDRWLLPMDKISEAQTLFEVRDDRSIFVSVASYRDENCPTTLKEMYSKADRPENLYVGLVQQNCVSGCRTGVLEGGIVDDTDPDINCYDAFCSTPLGNTYCRNVRNFFVDEAEALGPAVARYFASKLWGGETFFMQIDAHSLFEKGWDSTLVKDITNTPSYPYSVLSHYPPDTKAKYQEQPGYRICGGEFAASPIEHDIIRLAAGIPHDNNIKDKPCPAPFIGAGFFFVHASVLADVPFDPYVPWVFMGEEILLSLRFWTWGYDIYSPTRNVLSHFYIRRHTPKFWESVNRLFHKPSIHNDVTGMVINRVKNVAGYPESSSDVLMMPSLLTALELYGDGNVRAMEDYMALVGLDMTSKIAKPITWCKQCTTPYPV